MRRGLAFLLVLALVLAGCGGGEDSPEAEVAGGGDPEAVAVIEGWSDALREGDVEGAAEYFELPSLVQNGTPEISLDTREDVIEFNESLPCGAELVEAQDHHGFVIATFELTERPGPGGCGSGTGEEAQTAFVIEGGLITEWRRVDSGEEAGPAPEGPLV